jgi:hypothetical protein
MRWRVNCCLPWRGCWRGKYLGRVVANEEAVGHAHVWTYPYESAQGAWEFNAVALGVDIDLA